jgi:hypothetical protein
MRAFCYLRFGYCCHPDDFSSVYSGSAAQAFVIAKIFASLIFKPCMIAPVSPAGACGIPPWTYPVVTQHPVFPIMN